MYHSHSIKPKRGSQSESTPIYSNNGKCVAAVRGDTLEKSILGTRHILKKFNAIAFDVVSIVQAEKAGAKRIHITDVETGRQYLVSLDTLRKHGFRVDLGYGEQLALSLAYWIRIEAGQPTDALGFPAPKPPRQLELFGGGK